MFNESMRFSTPDDVSGESEVVQSWYADKAAERQDAQQDALALATYGIKSGDPENQLIVDPSELPDELDVLDNIHEAEL